MYRVRIRVNGKWITRSTNYNYRDAVSDYNAADTPKMFIDEMGIVHKQYTDNGFQYDKDIARV